MATAKLHIIDTHQDFYGSQSGLTHCGREYFGTTSTGRAIALQVANPERRKDDDLIAWKRSQRDLCIRCDRRAFPG